MKYYCGNEAIIGDIIVLKSLAKYIFDYRDSNSHRLYAKNKLKRVISIDNYANLIDIESGKFLSRDDNDLSNFYVLISRET